MYEVIYVNDYTGCYQVFHRCSSLEEAKLARTCAGDVVVLDGEVVRDESWLWDWERDRDRRPVPYALGVITSGFNVPLTSRDESPYQERLKSKLRRSA